MALLSSSSLHRVTQQRATQGPERPVFTQRHRRRRHELCQHAFRRLVHARYASSTINDYPHKSR